MTKIRSAASGECQAFTALLPLLEKPETDAQTRAQAQAHLATCASCRAQRRIYQQMEEDARRMLSPAASPQRYQVEEVLRDLFGGQPTPSTEIPTPVRRARSASSSEPSTARRFLASLGPLAAVLVIVALAATLFANYTRLVGPSIPASPGLPTGPGNSLNDLAMVSPTEGWAVGDTTHPASGAQGKTTSWLLHYQNGQWTRVDLTFSGTLDSLSMLSATDGWAIGSQAFLHYDGHTWKRVSGSGYEGLMISFPAHTEGTSCCTRSLQMLSDTDGWATTGNGGAGHPSRLLHYDGHRWTVQSLTDGLSTEEQSSMSIDGFDMLSPTEGWAIANPAPSASQGESLIWHEHEGQWTIQASIPHAEGLHAISMSSATDGWVVGNLFPPAGSDTLQPLLLHYTQDAWVQVANPATQSLPYVYTAVTMLSTTDGWMSGLFTDERVQTPLALMFHYDGTRWSQVAMPSQPYLHASILHIVMTSASDGWASGYEVSNDPALAQKHDPAFETPLPVLWHYTDGVWSLYQG
jgi:hypothetical protein